MLKVALVGSKGKMGNEIKKLIANDSVCKLICEVDQDDNIKKIIKPSPDIIIDFSLPKGAMAAAALAHSQKIPFLSGTTGLSTAELKKLEQYGKTIPVFYSTNYSLGIYTLGRLLENTLALLGEEYDIEILDEHHSQKLDSPSGTTKTFQKIISNNKKDIKFVTRELEKSLPRQKNHVGISVKRAGGIVGNHTITFTSAHEEVTLSHKAFARSVFASGAIKAAMWLVKQEPGFYGMKKFLE